MRAIETIQAQRTVTLNTSLEFCPIEANLWAYRLRVTPDGAPATSKRAVFGDRFVRGHEETGLVDDAGRRALQQGKPAPAIKGAPKNYSGKEALALCALGRDNIELFRTQGWWGGPKPARDIQLVDNVFEAFAAPDSTWTAEDLVYMDFGSERLYNHRGEPLPVAVTFDYMSSRIRESTYDLKALLAIFKTRDDLRPRSGTWEIMAVPGYNAEEGRTRSIEFVWVPTVEDYRKAVASQQGPYGGVREAFFALDIPGIAHTRLVTEEDA